MTRSLPGVAVATLALLALPQTLLAQDPPIKWGKIPVEHLEMTSYAADTNAAAVVLADFGEVEFDSEWGVTYRRHRRIKILTEAAYDFGTVMLTYVHDDRMERVSKIEGQTCTLGASGKPSCEKLSRKEIFDEDVDGRLRRYRFTLPALQPGAVIEYTYQVYARSPLYFPDWMFQTSEPTLHSEFRAEVPDELQYVVVYRGEQNYDVQEKSGVVRPWGNGVKLRYVKYNVPALREEPFMTRADDYRSSIEYQLARYMQQGHGMVDFLRTWPQLADELSDHPDFGKELDRDHGAVRDQATGIVSGASDPAEKLRRIYDYVRTNISWSGMRRYFPSQRADDVLRSKSGNSADVAFLLIALLRAADIVASPVLVSTRNHGQIIDSYPVLSQFNHIIVHANAGGREYLLDATDLHRPMDVLSYQSLNGKGWRFEKGNARWIPIETSARDEHAVRVKATLAPDGSLSATYESADLGYNALEKRRDLAEEDDDLAWVRDEVLADLPGATVESHSVRNQESVYDSLLTRVDFSVPGYAQVAGDFIYLNPLVVDRVVENPLKQEKRQFPVNFGYPALHVHRIEIAVPDGYEVQELPGRTLAVMPENGGRYVRTVDEDDGIIVLESRFTRTQTAYYPSDYAELRDFYADIVAAQGAQVVLKRSATGSADSGEESAP